MSERCVWHQLTELDLIHKSEAFVQKGDSTFICQLDIKAQRCAILYVWIIMNGGDAEQDYCFSNEKV